VLEKLRTFDAWRILVLPDHPTNIATRKHGYAPPSFCLAGSGIRRGASLPFSERNASASGLLVDPGHELMSRFITVA
jgi:2,3-bisphosphoglycerate-independent phosphoglycerate mutase